MRPFLLWHFGFWCRYAPPRADGTLPAMQQRESWVARSPLEALLARADAPAHAFLAAALMAGSPVDPAGAPEPTEAGEIDDDAAEAG